MTALRSIRWFAGLIALLPTAGNPATTPITSNEAVASDEADPLQERDLAPAAAGPVNVDPPIEETWYIEVLRTSSGADFRIGVLRSDPNVTRQILVLDSQGHFRDVGATGTTGTAGTTASKPGSLREALRGKGRSDH